MVRDQKSNTLERPINDPFADLMARFKEGDETAFEEILNRFESPVIHFAQRFLGSREQAEDVAQEVFLTVYQRAGEYTARAKLSTWIFTLTHRRCVDHIRKNKFRRFFSLEAWFAAEKDEKAREVPDINDPSPLDKLEKEETRRAVRQALAVLPEVQRTAVILSKYENMSLDEISKVLGVSTGAVKQLVFRAKTTIRRTLEKSLK